MRDFFSKKNDFLFADSILLLTFAPENNQEYRIIAVYSHKTRNIKTD